MNEKAPRRVPFLTQSDEVATSYLRGRSPTPKLFAYTALDSIGSSSLQNDFILTTVYFLLPTSHCNAAPPLFLKRESQFAKRRAEILVLQVVFFDACEQPVTTADGYFE